jgi:hypothetical protein
MAKSPKIASIMSHKGDASTIIPKQTREKKNSNLVVMQNNK